MITIRNRHTGALALVLALTLAACGAGVECPDNVKPPLCAAVDSDVNCDDIVVCEPGATLANAEDLARLDLNYQYRISGGTVVVGASCVFTDTPSVGPAYCCTVVRP